MNAQTPAKPRIGKESPISAIVPNDLDEVFRLAQALSMAGEMIPQHFQGRPEATMAAIARGMEIGLAPMQALSNIAVINGRACLWGDSLPAIVQKHGHHIDVQIEGEGEDAVATATLTRGDTGREITRSFSMRDAAKAGLKQKKGPWQQYPKRMLAHRARSWAVRDGAADALMGMQVAEEVQDYQPMRDVTPKETGFARLAQNARSEARTGAEAPPDGNDDLDAQDHASEPDQGASEPDAEEATSADQDEMDDIAIDTESKAYQLGVTAAQDGFPARNESPLRHLDEEHANWLAGFDGVAADSGEVEKA